MKLPNDHRAIKVPQGGNLGTSHAVGDQIHSLSNIYHANSFTLLNRNLTQEKQEQAHSGALAEFHGSPPPAFNSFFSFLGQ